MINFTEFSLKPEILKALAELGYVSPTPIQEKAIPQLLESNQDLKAFAQTGTGKTAAFSLPILQNIDLQNTKTQAIILAPTRELAIQITKNIEEYAKFLPNFRALTIYGGASIDTQIRGLKRGAQILVGTPGRTVDLIKRRQIDLSQIKWLVLDEADEMLNMGFKDELDRILEETPKEKQTLLFSATFPQEVHNIAKNYMNKPLEVSAGKVNVGTANVNHEYYVVAEKNRYAALKRIADVNPDIYGIIFCRTRMETQNIADLLIADGYSADSLHGDLSQNQRDLVMQKFRNKTIQLLVATDVAARGLDVNDLTHVINYKLPDQSEVYTHRSGRTGRAGKIGCSVSIINVKEGRKVQDIQRVIGKKFEQKQIPHGKEICEKQLFKLIDKVKAVAVNDEQIAEYLDIIYEKLASLDREELIKKFVSIEFNSFLSYYEDAEDLNKTTSSRDKDSSRNEKFTDENFTRYFINLGKKDNINPAKLIGLINDQNIAKNLEIGQIDILDSFSFFEADKEYTDDTISKLSNATFNGRRINVEITTTPKKSRSDRGRSSGGRDRGRRDEKILRDKTSFSGDRSSGNDRGDRGGYKPKFTSDRKNSDDKPSYSRERRIGEDRSRGSNDKPKFSGDRNRGVEKPKFSGDRNQGDGNKESNRAGFRSRKPKS
ncbi:MAG: DEAD/DEAH box helicase [Flavobacteriaceae bacterium]|nr:DEAD/DEAH box helicase [Flavobacteriaceae bacterium]